MDQNPYHEERKLLKKKIVPCKISYNPSRTTTTTTSTKWKVEPFTSWLDEKRSIRNEIRTDIFCDGNRVFCWQLSWHSTKRKEAFFRSEWYDNEEKKKKRWNNYQNISILEQNGKFVQTRKWPKLKSRIALFLLDSLHIRFIILSSIPLAIPLAIPCPPFIDISPS